MDTLANMLATISNGLARKRPEVLVPFSNFKLKVAEILVKEGFLLKAEKKVIEGKPNILIGLKYKDRKPIISGMKKISKPGRRIYLKNKDLREILSGMGVTVVSTSLGVKTLYEARRQGLGGEVICKVW